MSFSDLAACTRVQVVSWIKVEYPVQSAVVVRYRSHAPRSYVLNRLREKVVEVNLGVINEGEFFEDFE